MSLSNFVDELIDYLGISTLMEVCAGRRKSQSKAGPEEKRRLLTLQAKKIIVLSKDWAKNPQVILQIQFFHLIL